MRPDHGPRVERTGRISVELVSHASLLIRAEGLGLLTDPWLVGTAFSGGWRLLGQREIEKLPWPDVTHLWFSHAHPDHLHPESLSRIPAEVRERVTVLQSEQPERSGIEKMVRSLGFTTFERMRSSSWHRLPGRMEVFEGFFDVGDRDDQGDTYLTVRVGDWSVLNLNDCVVRHGWQGRQVLRHIGLDRVDLLCTQFSYGQWAGNPEEAPQRRAKAERKLQRLVLQAETLRAGAVMPFASYFAFCHRENHHLNDEVVTPDRVVNCLRKHGAATPIVLFPGERWTVGSPWDSDASCARWSREYASVTRSDDWLEDGPIVADEVFAMAERWNSRFAQALTPASRTILRCSGLAPRTTVRITDLGLVLDIVPGRSVKPEPATATCDVAMTSAAAARCFASLRGPEEIRFGGRMLRDNGRVERFLRLATTASLAASSSTPLLGAEVSRIGRRAVARSWAVRPAKPSSSNPSRQQSNDRKYDE